MIVATVDRMRSFQNQCEYCTGLYSMCLYCMAWLGVHTVYICNSLSHNKPNGKWADYRLSLQGELINILCFSWPQWFCYEVVLRAMWLNHACPTHLCLIVIVSFNNGAAPLHHPLNCISLLSLFDLQQLFNLHINIYTAEVGLMFLCKLLHKMKFIG